MGFLSSIPTSITNAQSVGFSDLPFMDFKSYNNTKENSDLKELFDIVPGLNTKEKSETDTSDLDSIIDNKDSPDEIDRATNQRDENKGESANDDYLVDSADIVDDTLANSESDKEDKTTSSIMADPSILTSILDKLPYTDVLSDSDSDSVSPSPSSPSSLLDSQMGDIIPGQYIVVLKEDSLNLRDLLTEIAEKVNIEGSKVLQIYDEVLNGFAIKVPNERIIEALEQNPFVDYIEKDKVVKISAQTLPKGINRVDGDISFTRSGNGYGMINTDIAILDTGIHTSHSDLNVYHQKTFVSGTSSGNDDSGHGTHVAGIAAAKDNSIGVVGIAPGAKLWAIKVLDSNGVGALSTIIKGIDYIRQYASQIEVANLSLSCQCKSTAFDPAINSAVKAGITFPDEVPETKVF